MRADGAPNARKAIRLRTGALHSFQDQTVMGAVVTPPEGSSGAADPAVGGIGYSASADDSTDAVTEGFHFESSVILDTRLPRPMDRNRPSSSGSDDPVEQLLIGPDEDTSEGSLPTDDFPTETISDHRAKQLLAEAMDEPEFERIRDHFDTEYGGSLLVEECSGVQRSDIDEWNFMVVLPVSVDSPPQNSDQLKSNLSLFYDSSGDFINVIGEIETFDETADRYSSLVARVIAGEIVETSDHWQPK